MRILLINTCYPFGSTGKIVQALEEHYNRIGHETFVLYGQGKKSAGHHIKVSNAVSVKLQALRRRITGIMYGGCYIPTKKTIRQIKRIKPDLVHLHCLNSNFVNIYDLITWLKDNHIPTVLTNHAEFMYTANCGHALDCMRYQNGCGNCPRLRKETKSWFVDGTHKSWIKMKNAFEGFDSLKVVNVSPWLTERASSSAILKAFEHYTVLNGVDTDIFYYRDNYLRKEEKTVFHATANFSDNPNELKGGAFLIQLARRFEGNNVKFVVAGKYSVAEPVPSNIILLGNIEEQDKLAELYSEADAVVLTSKKETFSMITAESLCCGTPVVGFKAGAPELISIPEYSDFVEFGDVEALYKATENVLETSFNKAAIAKAAQEKYSKVKMADEYIEVYNKCLQK